MVMPAAQFANVAALAGKGHGGEAVGNGNFVESEGVDNVSLGFSVRVRAGAGRRATAIEKGTQSSCGYNELY